MVTNGGFAGISGWEWRALRRTWIGLAGFLACIGAVNVFTSVQDHARDGHPIAIWEPAVWEATSVTCLALLAPLVFLAVRQAPPQRGGWLRFALVHLPASLFYSVIHVAGMLALRTLIYAAVGQHYGDDFSSFPYEYRKDLLSYGVMVAAFWLALKLLRPQPQASAEAAPTFDIRDGARLLRVPVAEIVSVASAGNYVEFTLADGRKPLMRATLAAVAAALEPHGLVRTHRSWLVNAGRVRGLDPDGSGDFTVELDTGARAPLSRRFPQALERLRGSGRQAALSA